MCLPRHKAASQSLKTLRTVSIKTPIMRLQKRFAKLTLGNGHQDSYYFYYSRKETGIQGGERLLHDQ